MIIKKNSEGNWYVCRRTSSSSRGRTGKTPRSTQATFRDWFFVKYQGKQNTGALMINSISFPKEFVGKKIKLKIEVKRD